MQMLISPSILAIPVKRKGKERRVRTNTVLYSDTKNNFLNCQIDLYIGIT